MQERDNEVVIVGGGAGGAELAVRLARAGCALRLIDQAATHVWKPRLHELAAGAARGELGEIAYRDLAEQWGFVFEQAGLVDIDPAAKQVTLDNDSRRGYRALVLAVGGVTPDLGVTGVREHAVMLDRSPDADALYRRFTDALDRAAAAEPARAARVVIVGTGLTGVELAGYLASHRHVVAKPDGDQPQTLAIHLVEASDTFMPGIEDAPSRRGARTRLADLGVSIHTGCAVAEVGADHVTSENGERFDADVTVWAAGRIGSPLAARIDALAANDRQQWLVRDTLQSRDHDDIFALGDCSACPESDWPATAQVASQQAEHLAEQVMAYLDGGSPSAFVFRDKGLLMSFGDGGDLGLVRGPLGDDLRIHGQVSHAAYRGLERQHQWVLLGTRTTLEGVAGDVFAALRRR
ncbi:FAD-dependent oxidoreductase [Salinisphaera sp.]|uniref:NAD(P)/FAD-dependent oxidoreductase n=1 Tax=Salinisphaera sp. TaxID=1914330 RepID=UPI0025D36D3F|nr:FAD-dependent oxidoreductase [Salinisphaera sp.]|tara:strand:+ start:2611 stop:3834 length:1224 start_codon:yes stop_codon:yes gene_type:complete